MTDKNIFMQDKTPENFKEYILALERANLAKIDREDKKSMVAKIIRIYEGDSHNGNS